MFLQELTRKPSGEAWCVVSSNRLIAVIWLNVLGDEAEIIDFRVDTSVRQQGVGRFLLGETLRALNVSGVKSVFLRCETQMWQQLLCMSMLDLPPLVAERVTTPHHRGERTRL